MIDGIRTKKCGSPYILPGNNTNFISYVLQANIFLNENLVNVMDFMLFFFVQKR